MKVLVVGAGVVGLTTALAIQERYKHYGLDIRIIAEKFDKATLSDGAAGLFRPSKVQNEVDKKLYTDTFTHFLKLCKSEDAGEYGAQIVSGYMFSDYRDQIENLWYKDVVLNFRVLLYEEISKFCDKKYGCFFTTVVIECRKYLPKLMSQFLENGGHKTQARLIYNTDINEFLGPQESVDFVVNCTGIEGSVFFHDPPSMLPVKGQVIRIEAPWIKHFWYVSDYNDDFSTYIIPTTQTVVLGGTREMGTWDDEVDPRESVAIFDRCSRIVPSVKRAKVLTQWAGLRPYLKSNLEYPTPRIDAHNFRDVLAANLNMDVPSLRNTILINNYGHGGNGISMSYGSAQRVIRIMEKYMAETATI